MDKNISKYYHPGGGYSEVDENIVEFVGRNYDFCTKADMYFSPIQTFDTDEYVNNDIL